jgi:hypothetical protein
MTTSSSIIPAAWGSTRRQGGESMADKGIPAWINIGSIVLLAALVVDFFVVIRAALTAH